MDDIISRQAAIDAVNYAETKEAARWSIKELPSAKQEIIQCKDCRFYYRHEFFNRPYFTCDMFDRYATGDTIGVNFEPPEDYYCAEAERRLKDE